MNKKKIILPLSIILIAIIVGSGIVFSNREYRAPEIDSPILDSTKKINIRPISNQDHILGNPDASVVMVEFSDLECPSCQKFHDTMQEVMNTYGKTGEVAWVYRHFPIEKTHPYARGAAIASECVTEVAGSEKFWDYIDVVFEGSPNSLLPENLKSIAADLGVDPAKYDSCLILKDFKEEIDRDLADGRLIYESDSNFGTPYVIVLSRSGLQTQIIGNQTYEDVVDLIELIK